MSCKATLTDLVEALTQSMSVVETAKTALHIELSQIIRDKNKSKSTMSSLSTPSLFSNSFIR